MPAPIILIILIALIVLLKFGVVDLTNTVGHIGDTMDSIGKEGDGEIIEGANRCKGNFTIINKIIGCTKE